jgi:glutamate carboxypeptidase
MASGSGRTVDAGTAQQEVLQWLGQQHDAMVELLAELVDIDSGSYHKAGVDAVIARLRRFLEQHGVACEIHPNDTAGNCLRASVGDPSARKPVVLMGHCDTVFPEGTAAERPFRVDGDMAYGPGVADMKAGLVMNSFVLAAMARAGAPLPMVGLYTADEEIASPASRPFIETHAANAHAVLNAEPGRPSGNVVIGRKGAMFVDCAVHGRAAHSGGNHQEGASAIEAIARKVVKLHALTDYDVGTTLNVGLIAGGSSVNTVAPLATASIDVRFKTTEAMSDVKLKLTNIIEEVEVAGTSGRVTQARYFLPLIQTEASRTLFESYGQAAVDLGFEVDGEYSGGSADSGFTAAAGVPTLCGTGPVGGKVHTPDEWLKLSTMVPRAQAVALTALRFAR